MSLSKSRKPLRARRPSLIRSRRLAMLEQLEDRRLMAVWTGGAGDNQWGTAGNWDNGDVPDSGGESAVFSSNLTAAINVAGTFTFGALQFTNPGGTYTLNGGTLSPASVSQSAAGSNTINSVIAGSGAVTVTGGAQLTLQGANTYGGGTNVTDGRIRAGHATAFGTGTVNIGAGSFVMLWWNTGSSVMANNFTLNGIGQTKANEMKDAIYADGAGGGFGTFTLSGTITLNADSNIGGNINNNINITGRVTGAGGLTIGGVRTDEGNTVTLSNPANDYSGNTSVVQGRLRLNAANVIPDGAGKGGVYVATGRTLDLGPFDETVNWLSGTGNVVRTGGATSITSFTTNAGSDISPTKTYTHKLDFIADAPIPGPATVNGVTFTAAPPGDNTAAYNYNLVNNPASVIDEGGGAASAPTFPDAPNGTGMNQLFRDFYYSASSISLSGLTAGVTYEARLYNRQWTAADRTQNFTFDEDGSGPISTPLRFDPDASATPSYIAYRFTAVSNGSGGAMPLVISFAVNNAQNGSYHLYGMTNEVVSTPTLTVGDGSSVSFDGTISGVGNIAKQGSGNWTLTGTNTYTGSTTINGGTITTAALTTPVAINGGGFEVPFNATPPTGNYSYNPAGSPWTFTPSSGTAGSGIAGNNSAFGNGVAPEGVQVGLIQRQGSISQTINVATAGTYAITLATRIRAGQQPNPFYVIVDGTPIGVVIPTSNTAYTNVVTTSFNLTAGNHNIAFQGIVGGLDLTSFIDNVAFIRAGGSISNAIPDTSPVTIASGATLNLLSDETVGPVSGPTGSNVTLTSGTLTVNSTANSDFGGTISGTGGLVKTNSATLTLSGGASSYSGATTINQGVLSVNTLANGGANSSIGAASNAAANLVLSGGTLQYTGAGSSTDRLFTLGASGGTIDSSGPNTGVLTFSNTGAIAFTGSGPRTLTLTGTNLGTNGSGEPATFSAINAAIGNDPSGATSIVKTGTGLWSLGGNSTYNGTTGVNQGVLAITASTSLGASAVNVVAGQQLQFNNHGLTVANNITLNGLTTNLAINGTAINGALAGDVRGGGGNNTLTGTLTLNATSNVTSSWTDKSFTIAGPITGPGGLQVDLYRAGNGAPVVTLASAGTNTYAGGTFVNSGTLNFTTDGQLGPSSNAVTLNTGTLSNTNTTGTVNFTHPIIVSAAGGTLNVAGNGVNGKMFLQGGANQITGSGTLTKNGGGDLQINQPQNFTGAWVINGLVEAQNATALGSGAVTVNNAELVATGVALANNLTLNTGATLSNNSGTASTFSGTINAAGNFFVRPRNFQDTTTAGRTINLTGVISGAGSMTVDSAGATSPGTVNLTNANTYTGATIVNGSTVGVTTLANGGVASGIGQATNVATNLVLSGSTLQYTGSGATSDRLFSVGTAGGTIDASGSGPLSFTNTGALGFNGQTGARTLTLTGSNTGANVLAASIADNGGATALTKTGAGQWTLSGNNTYTGATSINAGALTAAGGNAIGNASAVTLANVAGTQLVLTSGETIGSLAGGGPLGGNVSLGANNLTVGDATNTAYAGSISGVGGSLTKQGTGTLLLNGASTYTGATLVQVGTLGGSGSLVSGPAVSSAATLAPGANVGTFVVGPLSLVAGANLNFDLNTPITNQDLLNVTGTVTLAGSNLVLNYTGGSQLPGTTFVLIRNDGSDAVSGTFNTLPEGTIVMMGGQRYRITYVFNADAGAVANDVALIRNNGVIANDDFFTGILMNTSFSDNVMINDTDPDGDAFVSGYTQPQHGSVIVDTDGTFTYIPANDFAGNDTFTYTLSDGENSDTATVTLTVSRIVSDGTTLYVAGRNLQSDRIIIQAGSPGIGVRYNNVLTSGLSAARVVVYGNGGDDTISVSASFPFPVEFYGDGGNDYLAGGAGGDILDGGEGSDRLIGLGGIDTLYGGGGNDTASGGAGNDIIYGDDYLDRDGIQLTSDNPGKDTLNGDAGSDNMFGGAGNDSLYGGLGNDYLYGGDDNDLVDGGDGNDMLLGEAGSDKIYGRGGLDFLIGGADSDTLLGGVSADLMYASDLAGSTTDDDLREVFALWTSGQFAAAMSTLIGSPPGTGGLVENDGSTDSLNGEGDSDWYALFAMDIVSSVEKFGPNVKFNL